MKYYKNLIKRKEYGVLAVSIIVTLFGLIVVYMSCIEVINEGIKESGLSPNMIIDNGIMGIIASTDIGMTLMGMFAIYIGIVFIPINAPVSQDHSDYTVESMEDKIYIKFKNNEYLLKKETFSPTDLFFKDKNGKFVGMTRGYQIYNYVKRYYNYLLEKNIDTGEIIKGDEIISKFRNIRLMNNEEKNRYINYKKLKNRKKVISFCLSILFIGIAIYMILGSLFILKNNFITAISTASVGVIFLLIGRCVYKNSMKDIILINKIMNGKMYIADCYSYDKKICKHSEGIDYFIKVTDNNGHFVDKWFKIPEKIYKNREIVEAKIIVLEESIKDVYDVITNY